MKEKHLSLKKKKHQILVQDEDTIYEVDEECNGQYTKEGEQGQK